MINKYKIYKTFNLFRKSKSYKIFISNYVTYEIDYSLFIRINEISHIHL
jgi:hypothetical protein